MSPDGRLNRHVGAILLPLENLGRNANRNGVSLPESTLFLKFQEEQRGILTVPLACTYANCSPPTLHGIIKRGRIKSFILCGRHYVGMESLRDYVRIRNYLNGSPKPQEVARYWRNLKMAGEA